MALSRITEAVASFTDLTIGDDLTLTDDFLMASDASIIKFGADADVTLTHVHNTGLLLNSTSVIQFNDASQNIGAPSATVLDINATDEIELNATLIDVNGNLDVSGTIVAAGALTAATSITVGNAALTEAELELLDGITAGTAAASKVLVLDSDKDIGTIRNLTIDGVFTDGNYTFDTSGNVSGLGTVGSGNITSSGTISGTVITSSDSFVPNGANGASLGTASLEFSDLFLFDGGVINFGADQDVTLTHVADTGVVLNSSRKFLFNNSTNSISSDGSKLILAGDSEIELNATTIDINGNVDVSGTIVGASTLSATTGTFSGILKTDDATDATSTTDGSLQTDGGLSVAKDTIIGNDLKLLSDSAVLVFGAGSDATLTHTNDVGLTLNSTNKLMFNDASQFIQGASATVLDIAATDEIELTATLIEVVGNSTVSGTLGVTGIATFTDDIIIGDGKTIGSASDVDAITIAANGQLTLTQTLIGTALDISGDIDVDGTTNLDALDVDGATNFALDVTFADGSDIITASAGTSNFRAGVNAGNSIASGGNYNTVVGDEAGTAITTGDFNVAIGYKALFLDTLGSKSVAIGEQALTTQNFTTATDAYNVAVGRLAGEKVTTATGVTLIGGLSGDALTTGGSNVAVGKSALSAETGGAANVAVGLGTLAAQNVNGTGYNTAVGHEAGNDITSGVQNTIIGAIAGDSLTDADFNVAVGYSALSVDTLGSLSTAIGKSALANQNFTTATNSFNVAVGAGAGEQVTTGINNVIIGGIAGDALTDADNNVAVGQSSLTTDTKGNKSTAVGHSALEAQNFTSSTNTFNTAIGSDAGKAITTGIQNTFIGSNVGDALTDADNNTAVGFEALSTNTLGSAVVAIGYRSFKTLNYTTATDALNVGVGNNTGTAATTAQSSTFIGHGAGSGVTTGSTNTILGRDAGNHERSLQTGSDNTLIGAFTDTSATDSASQIVLGRNVTGSGNGTFTFGLNTSDSAIANGATSISAPSDIRLKEDIKDETVGLEFINELRPVTFRWRKAKDVPSEMKAHSDSEERVMNGKYNHGFIAQEVKEVIDKHDIKDGFGMWVEDEADGRQRIAESELVSILTKALQELSAKNDALEARIKTLEDA